MHLLNALAQTSLTWSLTSSEKPAALGSRHAVKTMLLTVVPEPGAESLSWHFRADVCMSLEQMMSLLLHKHLKTHPVLQAWLASKGHRPVTLETDVLESLGEAMHTGLRKLADTKQSVITWNALHALHVSDRCAFWAGASTTLQDAFEGGKLPTRHALALSMQQALVGLCRKLSYRKVEQPGGSLVERSAAHRFALVALQAACELTEVEEWMWGWLGYVVKDVPAADVADANGASVA